jgi:hypothetical protein
MSVQILNPLSDPDYDSLLRAHGDYSFFHSASWAQVLNRAYKYHPLYFSIVKNGNFTALLALMEIKSHLTGYRAVSLPFTDYCDLSSSDNIDLKSLLDKVLIYGRQAGWKTLEIRGEAAFQANVVPYSTCFVHELDLPRSPDRLFTQFRSSTRRNIQKAVKSGVKAKICHSLDAIRTYYRLHCLTRKRHGIPPQPYYFFEEIYKQIISRGNGFVVLSYYNSEPIAGAVYFHFGQNAIFKYGASDEKFWYLRANNLVMWTSIDWYIQNGFKTFSFGRTAPSNAGLLQFKRGWRPRERTISYFKYDFTRKCFVKEKLKSQILHYLFHHLPLPVLNLTGRLLYRHVG